MSTVMTPTGPPATHDAGVPAGTPSPRGTRSAASPDGAVRPVVLHRVVRSEWTKVWSLRSTWLAVGLALLIGLGLAAAIGSSLTDSGAGDGPGDDFGGDQVAAVLAGTGLASLVLGVLGALQMSGEYASGTITASLTAVPRRLPVLLAKAIVLVAVVAPLSLAMSAGALGIGSLVVEGGLAFSWAAVLGNTGYLTAVALLGLGLAAVVRSTAVSITALVAVAFVLPPLLPLLPWSWIDTAAGYFPSAAGQSLGSTLEGAATLSDTAAIGTLAAWVVVPLVAGAVLLARRDA